MTFGDVDTPLGLALRTARLVRGLSLRQLAAASGIPQRRLNAFEKGTCAPPPDEFYRVWEYFSSDTKGTSEESTQ
jgi:transcriptional regulator with XRE-family HTH domain